MEKYLLKLVFRLFLTIFCTCGVAFLYFKQTNSKKQVNNLSYSAEQIQGLVNSKIN
jgi:hypothetical protein